MPRLRELSGQQVLDTLIDFGYMVASQDGRHLKMKKTVGRDVARTLTFPMMQELDKLVLTAIFHEARQYVSEERLRRRFYED